MRNIPNDSDPWPEPPGRDARTEDRLAWCASVARWAPSKHNSQPWRFVIEDDALEVWPAQDRRLPQGDPTDRELRISCGAAIHLAALAGRVVHRRLEVALLPEGETGPLARLWEGAVHTPDVVDLAALEAIRRRRTDRGPLDATGVPELAPAVCAAGAREGVHVRLVSSVGDRATLARLVERADRLLVRTEGFEQEKVLWLRSPEDPRADGVPSDHTRGPAVSYGAEFVQRDFSREGSVPKHDRDGPDRPLLCVLCTDADRPRDHLTAGRGLAAVLLRTELAGAHASYLNQPIEEQRLRSQLRDQLDLPGVPQVVLRLGVGGDITPTPRRASQDVISHR